MPRKERLGGPDQSAYHAKVAAALEVIKNKWADIEHTVPLEIGEGGVQAGYDAKKCSGALRHGQVYPCSGDVSFLFLSCSYMLS